MFTRRRVWILSACGACIAAGAIGVFVFQGQADAESLLAASAVALLLGTVAFAALVLWTLATKGVTPLTEPQVEAAGRFGAEAGQNLVALLTAASGSLAVVGMAKLFGLTGVSFWLIAAAGIFLGVFGGYQSWRRLPRDAGHTADTTASQPAAGQDEFGDRNAR
jgi:hypothetical protein